MEENNLLVIAQSHKIYLAVKYIDFRCGIDALSAICRNKFYLDPFCGHYFIFRNRKASAIKILIYHSAGFWLCHYRLSKGVLQFWPKHQDETILINSNDLQKLLQNINFSQLTKYNE